MQRKKQVQKSNYVPGLMKWHCKLREGLIKTGSDRPNFDPKWGRFPPHTRFNVDQVPLLFAIDHKTTYEVDIPREEKRQHKVWVSNPGSGLEKHQCTLQVGFSPGDDSLRISVIFRGKGKRISADEKAAYHKDVDIYWQGNAWADTDVSVEWVRRTLAPAVANLDEFVLFCDNLEGQISLQFQDAVRKLNGIVWYGLANATDLWQPVDAGAGYLIKMLIDAEQQQWLEDDENVEKWLGNSETKLSAKDRRILLTHWICKAYRKFRSEAYAALRYRCFEKQDASSVLTVQRTVKSNRKDSIATLSRHPCQLSSQPLPFHAKSQNRQFRHQIILKRQLNLEIWKLIMSKTVTSRTILWARNFVFVMIMTGLQVWLHGST